MSQDDDLGYEEAVADVFDPLLAQNQPISRVSSGLSSNTSTPPIVVQAGPGNAGEFPCHLCSRPPYKTLKGLQNHVFLHKVDGECYDVGTGYSLSCILLQASSSVCCSLFFRL